MPNRGVQYPIKSPPFLKSKNEGVDVMCFRPSNLNKAAKCPHCGKPINAIGKFVPEKCPFCGEKMDSAEKKDEKNT